MIAALDKFDYPWEQKLRNQMCQDGYPARSLIQTALENLVEWHVAKTPLLSKERLADLVEEKLDELEDEADEVQTPIFLACVFDSQLNSWGLVIHQESCEVSSKQRYFNSVRLLAMPIRVLIIHIKNRWPIVTLSVLQWTCSVTVITMPITIVL